MKTKLLFIGILLSLILVIGSFSILDYQKDKLYVKKCVEEKDPLNYPSNGIYSLEDLCWLEICEKHGGIEYPEKGCFVIR